MIRNDIFEENAYCICHECGVIVEKRADARWVRRHDGWDHMLCTECAGKYPAVFVGLVKPPPAMATVIEADKLVEEYESKANEQKAIRREAIYAILDEEGYKEGLRIWVRQKEYEVTGRGNASMFDRGRIDVYMYPVTKKGERAKIGKEEIKWYDFIKLWRKQRCDLNLYLERCKKQDDELRARLAERRAEKLKFD
jgi:hypothetical protein